MKNKFLQLFTVLLSVFFFMIFFYGKIIFHPNDHLTTDTGDGIKAYYVFADHIKNDTSYHQFQNMNYPYGQTHIFTDGQTGIANVLKYLSTKNPYFETHCIGIYNMLMIFSWMGCALFVCLILQRLKMNWWFVVAGSCCITLLSPQIFRMLGHLTLSYTVFVPLSWWLLIKYFESKKRTVFWTGAIILNSIFWFFIHPYYVVLNSVFYIAYYFVHFLQSSKQINSKLSYLLHAVAQIAVPLIITRLYIHHYDIHLFRSQSPIGFWDAHARFNTVFAPSHGPFRDIFNFFFLDGDLQYRVWEGWSYIGLPSVFIAAFSIIKMIRYLFRKKITLIFKPTLPSILKTALWASVLVLLFSMCFPFRLGLDFLLDWFPFIKQFRSLGRFAWIFYYVFTVYSVYIAWLSYRYLRGKNLRLMATTFAAFFFAIYLIEAISPHSETSDQAIRPVNLFNRSTLNDDYRQVIDSIEVIKQKYQCIIPLPFYHVGTENFGKVSTDTSIRNSMLVSYWTNMPLLSSSAARSPIMEGKNSMQFFSPPYFKKEIEKDLPDKRPFLILLSHGDLTVIEHSWLMRAAKFFQNDKFELWRLPYDSVFKDNSAWEVTHFNDIKNNLKLSNGFYSAWENEALFYKNFDDKQSEHVYSGNGALKANKKNDAIILEKTLFHFIPDKDYTLSFWFYNKDELRNQGMFVIEEIDTSDGTNRWTVFDALESMTIDGDWSLVEKKFRPRNTTENISIIFAADKYLQQDFYVDDLLLKVTNADVYKLNEGKINGKEARIVKNNIPVFEEIK